MEIATLGEVIVMPSVTYVFGPWPVGVAVMVNGTTRSMLHRSSSVTRTGQYKSLAALATTTHSLSQPADDEFVEVVGD